MNLFAIAGLSVALSCVIMSSITLFFGKTKLHYLLFLFNIVVAVWGLGLFLVGMADTEPEAIVAWKLAHLGGLFVGPSFFHMVSVFCGIQRRKTIYFGYSQAIIFSLLTLGTGLIFNKVRYVGDIYFNDANPFYLLAVIIYFAFIVLSYHELLKFLRKTKGQKHTQTLYIIFGFMIGFIGANVTFLPMFHIDVFYPFGNFGITLYVFILTYAILRHRLMDIHLVFRRTIAYLLSAGLLTGFFIILVITITRLLSNFTNQISFKAMIIAALIMAFLFNPFKNKIQLIIEKVFYKGIYDYYSTIQNTSRELVKSIKAGDIYRYIIDTIFTTLNPKNAYLFLKDNEHFKVEYFRQPGDKPSDGNIKKTYKIDYDSELVKFLKIRKDIIIKDELPKIIEQDRVDIISEELKPFNGEVVVPIFIENELGVLLIFGEKLSGNIFSDADISLLNAITNQAAISLKNAILYEELEQRVEDRTAELLITNQQLQQEISERTRVEKELRIFSEKLNESNRELQHFAYIASHDLQEPLRMVTSYVQLLEKRYKDKLDTDADEFISYAVDGAGRMQGLINDLLTYSRVGTQGKPFKLTDCETVLKQVLTNLQATIKENKAEIVHDSLPKVMADDVQLAQLFQNLVGNAIKFHGDGLPCVHVSAREEEDYWVFSVSDNGIGIDEKHRDKIFQMFQRMHSKDEYPGTGIGLAVCKKIVERHGGRIWIESEPGKGSTFYFTMPVKKEAESRENNKEVDLPAACLPVGRAGREPR